MSSPAQADMTAREKTPVAPGARVATLDILRGFAILGMVLAHFHKLMGEGASGLEPVSPVGWFITLAAAEKDRAIFALLFGCGFALMMRNLQAGGHAVVAVSLRRLGVLYLFGFLVESLTQFAILRAFAWWGVALLFLRHYSTRSLLAVAVICAAAFSVRDIVDSSHAVLKLGHQPAVAAEIARQEQWEAEQQMEREAVNGANYVAVVSARIRQMGHDLFSLSMLTPNEYLALFILGFLAVRHGVFEHPQRHRRLFLGAMAAGLAIWTADWWLLPLVPEHFATPRIGMQLQAGLGIVDEQFLAFSYLGALALLLAHRPGVAGRLRGFGSVGRMALTNYIIHAALIDFASAPYGLNLRLNPAMVLLASAVLFGGLVLFSDAWLAHFRFGPVEWLWRSLTYWRWQPLRLAQETRARSNTSKTPP